MTKKMFETGEMQKISVLNCAGDLSITGFDEPKALLKGEDFEVVDKGDVLHIESRGDLKIECPESAEIEIQSVAGNFQLKNVDGSVTISEVMGELSIKNSAAVTIDQVFGDVSIKHLDGPLTVDQVMGNFSVRHIAGLKAGNINGDFSGRQIDGDVAVEQLCGDGTIYRVEGDLSIDDATGDLALKQIGRKLNLQSVTGDVTLRGPLTDEFKHHMEVHGGLQLYWPVESALQLILEEVMEVTSDIPSEMGMTITKTQDGQTEATLGEAGPMILASVHGDVLISPLDPNHEFHFDGESFSVDLDMELGELGQIGDIVGRTLETISTSLNTKFGPKFAEEISAKVDRAISKATSKIEKAQAKRERGSRRYAHRPPTPPMPPAPPRPYQPPQPPQPDQGAQQLKILEMLEAGDISVEDAATLLKALEI